MSELLLERRALSQDAVLREPSLRGLSVLWPLAAAAAVLYGSLIPFSIDWTALRHSSAFGLFQLSFHGATPEDIITNVLVYIPIGLTIVLCGRRRAKRGIAPVARIMIAIVAGTAISILAEVVQTGIAMRVPSWTDVVLNAAGTSVGALLGTVLYAIAPFPLRRMERGLTERPFATFASLLTVGLLLHGLLPFDFVTDTSALHASFLRARWDIFSVHPTPWGVPPLASMAKQLTGAAWFAVLAFCWARGRLDSQFHPAAAWSSAFKNALILASLIELMQLFTLSHSFDMASIILRLLAAAFGGWCSVSFYAGFAGSASRMRHDMPDEDLFRDATVRERGLLAVTSGRFFAGSGRSVTTVVLVALGFFQILVLLISNLDLSLLSLNSFDPTEVRWIPMEALWHRPMTKAVAELATHLVTFGALAVTLALFLSRIGVSRIWSLTGLVVICTAVGVEALQSCTIMRTADLTGPVLALISVVAAWRLFAVVATVEPAFQSVTK